MSDSMTADLEEAHAGKPADPSASDLEQFAKFVRLDKERRMFQEQVDIFKKKSATTPKRVIEACKRRLGAYDPK